MRGEEEEEDADSILFILLSAYTIPTDHFFSLSGSARPGPLFDATPLQRTQMGALERKKRNLFTSGSLFCDEGVE